MIRFAREDGNAPRCKTTMPMQPVVDPKVVILGDRSISFMPTEWKADDSQDFIGQDIYVVSVKDRPNVVKIGRTKDWQARQIEYAMWNLRPGDGIDQVRLYGTLCTQQTHKFFERYILQNCPFPVAARTEWFEGSFEDVNGYVRGVFANLGIPHRESTPETGTVDPPSPAKRWKGGRESKASQITYEPYKARRYGPMTNRRRSS